VRRPLDRSSKHALLRRLLPFGPMRIHSLAIRYFDAVRKAGSIREAARRLCVASSAVNRQILKLEAELGTPLFERLPGGLKLSSAGEVLTRHVGIVLRDAARTQSELDSLKGVKSGRVEVIAVESLAADFLPTVIGALLADHARVRVKVLIEGSLTVPAAIVNGDVDVGFAFSIPRNPELRQLAMGRFLLGAVMTPHHPLATRARIKIADCADYPLILSDAQLSIRTLMHPIITHARRTMRSDTMTTMTEHDRGAKRSTIPRPRDCTFTEGDWTILSQHWFPIAVAAEVADAPVPARLLDVDLVVFRSGDRVVVARDLCPHRGMMLSRGWVQGGQIVCPYHGLHFDGTGRCTSIPSQPDARISDRLSLTVLPSVERFGLLWATLAGDEVRLPSFDAWDRPGFQRVVCAPLDIAGSSGRQLEGFLDVAHFAWAHTGTFGDRSNPVVPDYAVDKSPNGLTIHYVSNVSNYSPDQSHRAPAGFLWRRTFDVFPPFAARLVVDYPDDKQLWILNAVCPVSARRTRLFCPIARNVDTENSVESVREFNARVFNEDRVLVESQRPEDLPLDLGSEISIPADRTSVAYRRLLRDMGLSLVFTG
jgi:vanillate O-demethylase monooxygenase subunit